jgi:hypothetical protein
VKNGTVWDWGGPYSSNTGKALKIPFPSSINLVTNLESNAKQTWVQHKLNELNLRPLSGGYFSLEEKIVIEVALVQKPPQCTLKILTGFPDPCLIEGVIKIVSTNHGKTWGDPIITTKDAEIFELGKTIKEQSFIARPIKINGKRIDVKFPPAPDVK